jgi:hypothetical protein
MFTCPRCQGIHSKERTDTPKVRTQKLVSSGLTNLTHPTGRRISRKEGQPCSGVEHGKFKCCVQLDQDPTVAVVVGK